MPSARNAGAEAADRRTRRRPGFAPAAGRAVRRRRAKRWPRNRRRCAQRLAGDRAFTLVANGATPASKRSPNACARIATCCRRRSTRSASTRRSCASNSTRACRTSARRRPALIEPLMPADPTLETLKLAEAWQPANAPQRLHGVWFDRAGTRGAAGGRRRVAPGFDPTGQQARGRRDPATRSRDARGTVAGATVADRPRRVLGRDRRPHRSARRSWIGTVDTIGLLLLLWRRLPQLEGRRCSARCRWPAPGWPAWARWRCCSTACTASPSRSASP